jgi:hypothetical protein
MTDGDIPADEFSPAEQRLSEHLDLIRASPPTAAPELIARILRRVRWQRAIRDPLLLMGAVVSAIGDSLRLLIGQPASDESARSEPRGRG